MLEVMFMVLIDGDFFNTKKLSFHEATPKKILSQGENPAR